jgi:alkaline phosphatase/alkaline phosphatase D
MKLALWVVLSAMVASACTRTPDPAAQSTAASVVMNGQGEMAGEVTTDSVILQSRLTSVNRLVDGDVPGASGVARFEIGTLQDFAGSRTTEWLQAVPEHDFIVKKRVEQLNPGTRYYYRLRYGPDEKNVQVGPTRSFKTLPGAGASVEVSFVAVTGMNYNGFYRGSRAYKGPDRELGYPALKTILETKPDFLVGTGDNVYYDSGPKHAQKPDDMRRFWHEQFVQPRMIDLMGQVATYWQKDDHDTRFNDSDNTGNVEPSPSIGKSIFEEQMPVVAPTDKDPRPYRTYRVSKDLQFWLTEGREYRSPSMSDDPSKTMWGAEQLRWLKQSLLESDATFKILISPTPMVGPDDKNRSEFGGTAQRGRGASRGSQPGAQDAATAAARARRLEGHDELKRDNMTNPGGYRHERDQFFAWLHDNGMLEKNFYIVSGDRHWQYYSIDPSGIEEFSTGAVIDENSRMGRAPGDPLGNDPKALVKQPYTSKEPSGGFLKVSVQPGPKPTAFFRFYDEHGVELYGVTKESTQSERTSVRR